MEKGKLKQNGVHLQEHEYATVKLLLENGYDIELIPPSQIKGLHLPDIMMQGIPWEIKSPKGKGKNTIRHTFLNGGLQSCNIIIDLRRTKMSTDQALKEIRYYFRLSKTIRRVMVILDSKEILDLS